MGTHKKLSDINFFICSTFIDLIEYRTEVIKKIESESGLINAQEFFGARGDRPIETCLSEVEQSDVFIMFLGFRYGSIDEESGKAFIEREYEKALELDLPIFIFFMDDSTPLVRAKYIDKNELASKLDELKNRLKKRHTIDFFTTPEDLSNKVVQALLNELPKKGFQVGDLRSLKSILQPGEVLRKFITVPKLHYGIELQINVTLGSFRGMSEDICNAFSFRYGASAERNFNFTNNVMNNEFISLTTLYANSEEVDALMTLPSNQHIEVLVKTIQGTVNIEEPLYSIHDLNTFYTSTIYLNPKEKVRTGTIWKEKLIYGLQFISVV